MRIAIVNDTVVVAEALRRIVAATPEHQVAWVAYSGADALHLCAENRPDLILMDLIMPQMDGVEATRLIMQNTPCAILIVTASPDDNVDKVFRALGAGALDVTTVPRLQQGAVHADELLAKIKMIGKLVRPLRKVPGRAVKNDAHRPELQPDTVVQTLVAIGASTGGPLALATILSDLAVPESASLVIVQHIDERFAETFATWLRSQIVAPLRVIEDGSALIPGHVLLAKTNDHLVLDENCRLHYSPEPRNYPFRPSADVFFHCIADHWCNRAVGVLLTGMGRDGAAGLLAMRCAGQLTIVQDQASSAVYGMPRAAVEMEAADMILPLPEIGATLHERMRTGQAPGAG